ncbi:hypothetical protein [Lentzea jiangxiensis]|uniref:Uncharacterized protein n=1 Tax=Lentzea jiangxiensis TaxID=641025 RepID=A0A1H0SI94_9PSEU|nr:hypothetical protein [Lentzea jiangxiensis]SDP41474.1 hypothetical protein SAMN05421507_10887 [Lentzea jiangxiensis]
MQAVDLAHLEVTTERFVLRPWRENDLGVLAEAAGRGVAREALTGLRGWQVLGGRRCDVEMFARVRPLASGPGDDWQGGSDHRRLEPVSTGIRVDTGSRSGEVPPAGVVAVQCTGR